MAIIEAIGLEKTYKIAQMEPGVLGGLRSLLARKYKTVTAIDDISFAIEPGEVVGYIGPNGAGKSTTIKILSGVLYPTAGKALVGGIEPYENRRKNARQIGVVFGQKSQLYWDLPVTDSFDVFGRLYELDEQAYRRSRALYVEMLGIEGILDQPARQLSLGQKMKANLALAMLHNPRILYLDEPTIGLDVSAKKTLRQCITMLSREKGVTVILTSHDMDDIESVCGRIILIDEGKRMFDGSVSLFKTRYESGYTIQLGFDDSAPSWQETEDFTLQGRSENTLTIQADRRITPKQALLTLVERYDPSTVSVQEESVEKILSKMFQETAKP